MPDRFHIEEDTLIQFALGSGKDAQMNMLTAHVSMCTECRARLGAIQLELAAYAAALPDEGELPAGSRQRFLSRLSQPAAQESRLEQVREQGRTSAFSSGLMGVFSSPPLLWSLCAVLAAAVAIVGYDDVANIHANHQMIGGANRLENDSAAYLQIKEFLSGEHTQQVTLHQSVTPNFSPTGHATYMATTGQLIFTAANMQQLPAGKVYALWLLPAAAGKATLAGTFTPDLAGNGAIIFPKLPEKTSVKTFAISIEETSTPTKPTMPWILTG